MQLSKALIIREAIQSDVLSLGLTEKDVAVTIQDRSRGEVGIFVCEVRIISADAVDANCDIHEDITNRLRGNGHTANCFTWNVVFDAAALVNKSWLGPMRG